MQKLRTLIRWEFIRLGYQKGLTPTEIAAFIGWTPESVKVRASALKCTKSQKAAALDREQTKRLTARRRSARGGVAAALVNRDPAPITLVGPHWSVPLRKGVQHSDNLRLPSNPKRALADMQAELERGQG